MLNFLFEYKIGGMTSARKVPGYVPLYVPAFSL